MTSYATLRDNANSPEDGLAPTNAASSLELASSADNLANDECIKKINTPSTPGYDPDSFSESEREKMDSTPENIKKIDDVIDDNGHHHQEHSARTVQQTHHHYNTTYNNTPPYLSPRSEQTSNFGLAAAVDDSNAKYCLAKPLCNIPKEMNAGSKSANKEITRNRDNKNDEEEFSRGGLTQQATITSAKTAKPETIANKSNSEKEARVSYDQFDGDESTSSNGNTTMTNSMKQSCAFTIDNFNDKECDAAAQAAKYKSMMERFQNRHRRGASMSKLENENESSSKAHPPTRLTSSQSSTPLTARSSARSLLSSNENNANSLDSETSTTQKVKLRVRDRSTSRVRDASKRHSWSPRSSTNENSLQSPQSSTASGAVVNSTSTNHTTSAVGRKTTKNTNKPPPIQVPKGSSNLVANRTQFTPRSTAMQLALKQVDFMCPQPPLADFKHLNADADDVSEAGTYTLDGDNYTEEQKDLMNIDKNGQPIVGNTRKTAKSRPKHLETVNPTARSQGAVESKRCNNVLEVNYYHDTEGMDRKSRTNTSTSDLIMGSHQSAGAYLEKIKSRVLRNMNATKQMDTQEMLKSSLNQPADEDELDPDQGCFTSVTTSGVLAKQRTLDARPKLSRHSGLSTSQIDSSEYVSNETKLKSSGTPASLAGGFTDHQKAEYRLNVFTNQKDVSQKFAATRNLIETPPESPSGLQTTSKISEIAVLQTAQTKHDWIQEWARNARARSLANDRHTGVGSRQTNQDILMTRSYTCADTGNESLTDDSLYSANSKQLNSAKLNRTLAERYRLSGVGGTGDCDYASDPSLTTSTSYTKPPKSPTKIPSPLHSLGRARSASRTRASLQNMLPTDDEDYLQQTAAAINNLQQSLSRKNSLKSPSHSASPRAHSARSHIMYSPEGTGVDSSPQHSLNAQRQRQAAQNLMTSSINEQQLQLLTSGEYLLRQMRMRKNSFDGNLAGNGSPHRRILQSGGAAQVQSPTTPIAADDQSSPLRRSSSFSARVAATQRAARPNFQNIYTPPAARHSYGLSVANQNRHLPSSQAIKKSASSNNFGHVYSDYDDNLQYYINDEDDQDDIGEEYYSSGAEENLVESEYYNQQPEQSEVENSVPLTNTRYNKALLMRIERSKQKVAGKPQSAPPTKTSALSSVAATGGVIACPNTPELPRRNVKSATTRSSVTSHRQSMPRDTSLSRLAQQVPNSLASAKKQLLQTAANVPSNTTTQRSTSSQRAQPRYLDISKYKPAQSNQFLRKNDAKSTLKQPSSDIMKRSPSSSSMGLSRTDPSRTSNRSVRSSTSVMTTSGTSLGGGRASSAVRRDNSVSKQKEAEMAMWKRRSKYDPMKAAAEDRRKKEEAKRLAQGQQLGLVDMPTESERSLEQQWSIEETGDFDEDDCA